MERIYAILTLENNQIDQHDTVIAINNVVTGGTSGQFRVGENLEDVLEDVFYKACRQVNPDLPREVPDDLESLDINYPNLDTLSYVHNERAVRVLGMNIR